VKAIILAAGYATRLYPLTRNFPKPLLEVGGITILDRLISQIHTVPQVTQIIIVTNHCFKDHFATWLARSKYALPLDLLDDGSTENENRLGAVKDLALALTTFKIDDEVLVVIGRKIHTHEPCSISRV
jgi:glucose-1-phosphate thymidylyltransferase